MYVSCNFDVAKITNYRDNRSFATKNASRAVGNLGALLARVKVILEKSGNKVLLWLDNKVVYFISYFYTVYILN